MSSDKFEVRKEDQGKALFASKEFEKDEMVLKFEENFRTKPSKYSLQAAEKKHQFSKSEDAPENFIDHSCNLNC